MTDDERPAFMKHLEVLENMLPGLRPSPRGKEIYFRALRAFQLDEITQAVEKVLETAKFFPVLSELLECCRSVRAARRAALEGAREEQLALQAAERPEEIAAAKARCHELVTQIANEFTARHPAPGAPGSLADIDARIRGLKAIEANDPAHRARKEKARLFLLGAAGTQALDNVLPFERRKRDPFGGAA